MKFDSKFKIERKLLIFFYLRFLDKNDVMSFLKHINNSA